MMLTRVLLLFLWGAAGLLSPCEARLHGAEAHQPQPLPPPIVFDAPLWQPDQPWQQATIHEDFAVVETALDFDGHLWLRPLTDAIVVHHVGVPSGDVSARAIHRAHLANGWEGIGYHYVVRQSGAIERGRPLEAIGAHAEHQNDHTVGVCLTGNFEWEWPRQEQLASLTRLLTFLCRAYRLPADDATILGHRDLNQTACPGGNLYGELGQVRAAVTQRLLAQTIEVAPPPPPSIARRVTTSTTDRRQRRAR